MLSEISQSQKDKYCMIHRWPPGNAGLTDGHRWPPGNAGLTDGHRWPPGNAGLTDGHRWPPDNAGLTDSHTAAIGHHQQTGYLRST